MAPGSPPEPAQGPVPEGGPGSTPEAAPEPAPASLPAAADPASRGPGWTTRVRSHPLLPWYAALLGGILPVLLLGFLYSALADRLEFAGWALLLAALYTAALRQGMQAGWPAPRLAGALALLLAAGAAAFAWIERTHHEILDLGYRNVHFRHADGTMGWPEEAPFDRIMITAGAPEIPRELLLGQLKDGGLAVLPAGPEDDQMLLEVRRDGDELKTTDICPCRFVKLIGKQGWPEK